MKLQLTFFLSILVLALAGCSTPRHKDTPLISRNAVRDVDIRSATFGAGTNVADVTERVIQLLRSDAAGFSARAEILGIDPLPYRTKVLVIDYYYKGKPHRFSVANQQHVSYELLVKNANR